MKSRWTTYVLLVVVLAVWGAVAWKIFNPSSKDEANTVPQVRVQTVPKEHQDTLLCDYPDPFLKGVRKVPALTQWIIGLSKSFPLYGTVILLAVATAGGLLYRFRHDERVRARSATFILRIPVVGGIVRRHYQSHFCKLLYLLSSSGVPLLEGITMLPEVITFYPYQQSFARIGSGLEQGESFAANVGRYPGLYDRKLAALIRVGEETNRLPEMLSNQADALTRDLEYRIRQLGSMLEPVLILFVGVLVAVILISMYMPMFRLGGIMG